MCTVTYIPTKNGAIITSNRDEATGRTAMLPMVEDVGDGLKIAYPKDSQSKGTWFAIKNNAELAVLLNGAFENHEKLPYYRESRGTIFLNIFKSKQPEQAFMELSLDGIENFTLILYKPNHLIECRWDGEQKYVINKDPKETQIWSSVTLYDKTIQAKREKWFSNWLTENNEIDQQKVIDFHRFTGNGDLENDLVMYRKNGISTVSITSAHMTNTETRLTHTDLKDNTSKSILLPKNRSVFGNLVHDIWLSLVIAKTRIMSWEYWPMHLVYAPMYFYWFYLSFKAKSFFFFSAANPKRKNAGFAMERKSDSYQHLPQQHYPKTVLVNRDTSITSLKVMLDSGNIVFPVIAKPDMGERGTAVQLLPNLAALSIYNKQSKVDFLIQEFIDYPNEIGIFYSRIPGQLQGKITGIVGKELLAVTGDGKSNLVMLVKKSKRHLLQLRALERVYGNELYQILPLGQQKTLVYYGNHCRGAKFIDLSTSNSEKLTNVIDQLCKQVPQFYFGRLDIKFNSWEELEAGLNFSVIELNGAASEPTHIYDPKHTIFYAWREIKRHWDLLYLISDINAKQHSISLMNTKEGLSMLRAHAKHLKMISE